ncbi:U3 small nucleolar RNA-interacting protein 2-like isoform X2 [Saccostrea echinata]|uniref:U3 small nucleolar RNA-interacting protein 2-like isoform X2 n=1 Tax=Saccostrea echinata TaxID=191078 RepID=UPI002A811E4E|nr:U3 small nucleolar RNA-interacting protein 2-like isoform X2 [Saccostrea echinata]
MPFFIKSKGRKQSKSKAKHQRPQVSLSGGPSKQKRKKLRLQNEEIDSESEIESDEDGKKTEVASSSDEEETAQEKKLRLAKEYLASLEQEEAEKREQDDIHRDIISHRLKQDLLEQTGKLQKSVADEYIQPSLEDIIVLRGHQLTVTCVVISPDKRYVFSGSKDCSIIKWDVEEGRRLHTIHGGRKGTEDTHTGHTDHVLCLAMSSDGKFLASGGKNKFVLLWNPDNCQLIHKFTGHRDSISGLAFRIGSHQLFSASHDRSVKIWNVDELAYIETLFGHSDAITDIDSLIRDRAITSGGRDGSIRIWKVVEESQLVFNGDPGSIDCVAFINESNFISGADNNSLSLWSMMKKKPIVTVKNAHCGQDQNGNSSTDTNWITAVAALHNTDLVASGSKDGCIKLWKTAKNNTVLQPLFSIPMDGFVNSLQFSVDGQILVAGVGQEHKLGRWWRIKDAKNGIRIIKLKKKHL